MNQSFFHQNDFSFDQALGLPIIAKLTKTYKLWQDYLLNFPRTSRYTIGLKTDSVFIETIETIFAATHERERERE